MNERLVLCMVRLSCNCEILTEAARLLEKTDDELHTEISRLRGVMDALHLKHKEISAEIESAHDLQAKDQAEIKCLAGMCLDLLRST